MTYKGFLTLIHKQTDKAYLTDYGWFPKSQCKAFETDYSGMIAIIAPQWLINKKDIVTSQIGKLEKTTLYFTFGKVRILRGYTL